ncbi:VOC family protein [Brevibacterium sp. p3-SID960]
MCLDGGPAFQLSEAISFTVACQDQDEIDYYWKDEIDYYWEALSHVPDFE